jgi:creatinine amidohydrolase/Fe(II)-dependent formamide hydrolase-like protein
MLAEAYRAAARSLRRYSWSLNAIGVFWQCTPQTMTQPIMSYVCYEQRSAGRRSTSEIYACSIYDLACAQVENEMSERVSELATIESCTVGEITVDASIYLLKRARD